MSAVVYDAGMLDASVVVCALSNGAAIVTSAPEVVGRLVEASGAPISVLAI